MTDPIARWISGDEHGRAEARVDHGPHVWAVIGHIRANGSLADACDAYGLTQDAVVAALLYHARYSPVIDAWHTLNNDAGECLS